MNRKVYMIVILAVLMFTLGVRAAAAEWASLLDVELLPNSISSFLPILFRSSSAVDQTPAGVLYVFSSADTTNAAADGRPGMNAICSSEDPIAHYCTVSEVENAFGSNGVYFATPITKSWIDSPLEAPTWKDDYDNCSGWTSTSSAGGKAINNKATDVIEVQCSQNIHVACCKWVP